MDAEQLVAALPDGVAPPVHTVFPDRTTEWSLTPLDHPPSRRARSAGAGSRRDHHGVALPRATGAPRFAGPSSTMGAAPSDVRHQQLRRARSESGSPDLVQQVQRRVHQRPGAQFRARCHHSDPGPCHTRKRRGVLLLRLRSSHPGTQLRRKQWCSPLSTSASSRAGAEDHELIGLQARRGIRRSYTRSIAI